MNPADSPTSITAVTIPPEVMARQVGDETVLLDLASGKYFGLDPVGTRMWHLLAEGKPLAAVCDAIAAEFEVARPQVEEDLQQLLAELKTEGLVRTS
jgi:hypothetical protein